MSEPENNTTPATPAQPVFPPIDATKAVPPVTPFPAWTWNTPVIPQFYWNVYSSEQRIRQICVEIGRIQAYLEYFAANSNAAHWYLDNRFTQVETRLTARVDKLETELGEEVARLDKALADETRNRTDGDKALQARIDATKTALEAETTARVAGDKANADAIAKETAAREAGYDQLANDLATETAIRGNADTALGGRIDAEATARQDADTHLGERIVAEHTERVHDVRTLATGMNRRPLASAITAKEGSGVTVESKETDDGSGTGVVIGSTWQGDFTAMRNDLTAETAARTNADGALEAKLNAETDERRHDDTELGRRIDGKLAFGAVRAGAGITVVNDPDTTTATVSAEVTKAKLDEAIAGIPAYELPAATAERLGGVKVGTGLTVTPDGTLNATGTGSGLETVSHDDTMTGDGTAGNPLKVRPATATTLGGVKPGTGLTVTEDGTVSAEVTKAKLDEAIAGIPAYKLPAATAERLGGVKVGTGLTVTPDGTLNATGTGSGLETVSHDDTMTGDGTAGNPLKVRPATATTLGGVKPGTGLTVTEDGTVSAEVTKEKLDEAIAGISAEVTNVNADGMQVIIGSGATNYAGSSKAPATAVGANAKAGADDVAIGSGAKAPTNGNSIAIGASASSLNSASVAIGFSASTETTHEGDSNQGYCVAIGSGARAVGDYSVALGANSTAEESRVVAVGSRRIVGVVDPTADSDAATKAYVDKVVAAAIAKL